MLVKPHTNLSRNVSSKLKKQMSLKFTIKNPMPPIWMMYPDISQFSIGWRMGYGEGYKWDLYDWYEKLTIEEKTDYDEMFPKPKFWEEELDDNYYDLISFWEKNGEMKHSIGKLFNLENYNELEYFYFWKPKPNVIGKYCLGQWQMSKFSVDTEEYTCAEQYMMAEKARLFKDKEIEEKIMNASEPNEMKKLGKEVKNFDKTIWDKVKYSIVLNGNYYKFSQNPEMRDFLLSTGNKILVEASPLDKIWGIGLREEDVNAKNPLAWRGKNLLGFALMELRDDLKKVYSNYHKIDWKQLNKYIN